MLLALFTCFNKKNDTCYKSGLRTLKCPVLFDLSFFKQPSPYKHSGTAGKYKNQLKKSFFIINKFKKNNEKHHVDVLIIKMSGKALTKWNNRNGEIFFSTLYGKKIDVVSGTFIWKNTDFIFEFNNTPVIEVNDFEARDPEECECDN